MLASNCDEPTYVKLVEALYAENQINLTSVDDWIRKWQPTLVFFLGKSHGQRSLAGCSTGGHKELDTTEQLRRHKVDDKKLGEMGRPITLIERENPIKWFVAVVWWLKTMAKSVRPRMPSRCI